jgi:hypothetical protein
VGRDRHPGFRQLERDPLSDAGAGAGDKSDFSFAFRFHSNGLGTDDPFDSPGFYHVRLALAPGSP